MSAELRGVGVGLVSMPRFERALARFGDRLLTRLFTPAEIAYASRKRRGAHSLAGRFAAKCAGRAALRQSGRRVMLSDLEVVRRRSGEPTLVLLGDPEGGPRLPCSCDRR